MAQAAQGVLRPQTGEAAARPPSLVTPLVVAVVAGLLMVAAAEVGPLAAAEVGACQMLRLTLPANRYPAWLDNLEALLAIQMLRAVQVLGVEHLAALVFSPLQAQRAVAPFEGAQAAALVVEVIQPRQAALADQAGVSKRTVERLESGAVATQLSGFLRVCRVLGLVEHFESLIPEVVASPMEQLKRQGVKRRRASVKKAVSAKPEKWTWGDES